MPVITIKTHSSNKGLDLKVITKGISIKSGIEIERLNVIAQYFEESDFYTVSKSPMLVHVEVCERNGKEIIHKLMESIQYVLINSTKFSRDKITVYCHPIPNEYLLINDKYI